MPLFSMTNIKIHMYEQGILQYSVVILPIAQYSDEKLLTKHTLLQVHMEQIRNRQRQQKNDYCEKLTSMLSGFVNNNDIKKPLP